jgi:Holliday junction resolvasome RuvABC endonuclease subunit
VAEAAPVRLVTKGDKELERAFRQLRKETLAGLRPALRQVGEIVRREGQALFERYDPKSAAGYRVVVRMRGVAVEQRYRRTTGEHPEFGPLQMEKALVPALEANEENVTEAVDRLIDGAEIAAGL